MPVEESWFQRSRSAVSGSNVATDDDRVCRNCGYALKGLPEGTRCPECGQSSVRRAPGRTKVRRITDQPVEVLKRIRLAAWLALLAWASGVSLWVAAYYPWINPFVLPAAITLVLASISSAWLITSPEIPLDRSAWREVVSVPNLMRWMPWVATISAAGLIAILRFGPGLFGSIILLTLLTVSSWMIVQVLACIVFGEIARMCEDDVLATNFHQYAKLIVVVVFFMAPFQALMQWISLRAIGMPVICLGCYFLVLAFVFGQVFFGWCLFRITGLMKWALIYQKRDFEKGHQMRERLERERAGGAGASTRFERD